MSTYRKREREYDMKQRETERDNSLKKRRKSFHMTSMYIHWCYLEHKHWDPEDMEISPCHPLSFMAARGFDISSQLRSSFIHEHPLEKKSLK